MRRFTYSFILLAIVVGDVLCDTVSAAYRKERRSMRVEIPGINTRRRTRSTMHSMDSELTNGDSSDRNDRASYNFGTATIIGGQNTGPNNQNVGINFGTRVFDGVTNNFGQSETERFPTRGSGGGLTNTGTTLPTTRIGGETPGTSTQPNASGVVTHADQSNGCVLPAQPTRGRYQLASCTKRCHDQPGTIVPFGSSLIYTCYDGYTLQGFNVSLCLNNVWHTSPTCAKSCPALKSDSIDTVCKHLGKPVSCESDIKPGTEATMACKHSYNILPGRDPVYRVITCLDEGVWDRNKISCLPECGVPVSYGDTLVVGGFTTKFGSVPWHVGIYKKSSSELYSQICGGTLISPSLVISAAHCFYDDTVGKLDKPQSYAVAAGKHYRSYYHSEEHVQKSAVSKIEITNKYFGLLRNYAEDIALLHLNSPFILSNLIKPICMDLDKRYEREQLQSGKLGKVVGWGKTAEGDYSTELQEINVPFIPFDQCNSAVPEDFRGYITGDKFCAGYLNGSSLCNGDSGGGLSFQLNGLWYLRGIVSVSPTAENTCDNNYYTVFTNVGNFGDWIRNKWTD